MEHFCCGGAYHAWGLLRCLLGFMLDLVQRVANSNGITKDPHSLTGNVVHASRRKVSFVPQGSWGWGLLMGDGNMQGRLGGREWMGI